MANGGVKRVFLSSTAEDLREHRDKVSEAIQRLDQSPVRMETFGARPNAPVEECCRLAASADALVAMVAHRYGWIPSVVLGGDGKTSITRLEVEAAAAKNVPIFAFVVDDKHPWAQGKEQDRLTQAGVLADPAKVEQVSAAVAGLQAFKHWLDADIGLIRDTFTTPDNLAMKVATSLARAWSADEGTPSQPRVAAVTNNVPPRRHR